jgi:hypothetical protein
MRSEYRERGSNPHGHYSQGILRPRSTPTESRSPLVTPSHRVARRRMMSRRLVTDLATTPHPHHTAHAQAGGV